MMKLCGSDAAVLHTAAAEPAFIGIRHQRQLAAFRIRDHYVHAAHVHAAVAAGKLSRIRKIKGSTQA